MRCVLRRIDLAFHRSVSWEVYHADAELVSEETCGRVEFEESSTLSIDFFHPSSQRLRMLACSMVLTIRNTSDSSTWEEIAMGCAYPKFSRMTTCIHAINKRQSSSCFIQGIGGEVSRASKRVVVATQNKFCKHDVKDATGINEKRTEFSVRGLTGCLLSHGLKYPSSVSP